jgi:RNA polymerase sigma factor (sigma-70 family)
LTNKALEIEFEQLIKSHELLVFKVCRIYAYDKVDRQDLFQEIVLQLWKSYPKFKQQSKFSTWLYRVAIYTAIAGLRKQTKIIQFTEPESLTNIVGDIGYDNTQDEQLTELYKAIEQLNEIEKAIIMLYLEDKSYEEMEEILCINQGNLRVKMTRIKDKLKQLTKN